jgi:murein DD-endopeptidase MepM/ murein hydrolase activator NlpD
LLIIVLLPLSLTACQMQSTAVAAIMDSNASQEVTPVVIVITATPSPTPPPTVAPVIVQSTLPPPAPPTAVPTDAAPQSASATPTATAVIPTHTPMPTFTPPALPDTLQEDHYWLRRPVAEGGIVWTDKFYPYGSTRSGQLRPHHGVEFNVPYNTEILAAASGIVVAAGPDSNTAYGPEPNFYGNLVVIEHTTPLNGQPVYTLYGHLNTVYVQVGQQVEAEEIIGLSGATGVADGPHLHFEVRLGENSYDHTYNPLLWLWPFPDRGTVVGRVVWPDGTLVQEAPVVLRRIDATVNAATTTTYAAGSTNADPAWQENFALDDVHAGYYQVTVQHNKTKFTQEVWVYPRRTSFVEIVIEP